MIPDVLRNILAIDIATKQIYRGEIFLSFEITGGKALSIRGN